MTPIKQSDPLWHNHLLGYSKTTTFGWGACLLSDLTFGHNELRPMEPKLTPIGAQDLILKNAPSGFVVGSSSLVLENAAPALGLVCKESERIRARVGDPALAPHIINGLKKGFVILHVDEDNAAHGYDADDKGKHFIICVQYLDGNFVCMDPAPGAFRQINSDTLRGESDWGGVKKLYRVVSAAWLYKI